VRQDAWVFSASRQVPPPAQVGAPGKLRETAYASRILYVQKSFTPPACHPNHTIIYALEARRTQTNAQEALETNRQFQLVTKNPIIEI
jgi:hypothetical protein